VPIHVSHLTVGENRGAARLWLQGPRLLDAGFTPGSKLRSTTHDDCIVLVSEEAGDRTVSSKDQGKTPVIDICGRAVSDVFPVGTRIEVSYFPGRIVIRLNPREGAVARRVSRLKEKIRKGAALATAALCLGAGILDAALAEGLGPTEMVYAVEREAAYLDQAVRHHDIGTTVHADLSEVDFERLPTCDVLVAGIPCTAASRSGRAKQRSLDPTLTHPEGHPEGALFVDFLRAVISSEPAIVVLENVPVYRHSAGYAAIRAVLHKLQYTVTDAILNAADWGCNEARERLVMVGAPFPVPLDDLAPHRPARPLADLLDPAADNWRPHGRLVERTAQKGAEGCGFKLQLVTAGDTRVGTIGRGYAKDRMTEPHLVHPQDPSLSRLFTVAEHARIKGVPERLVEGLGFTIGHEVLGQAIAYPPFVSVGRRIIEAARAWALAEGRVAA